MTQIKIGIMPQNKIREYTKAIVSGKYHPKKNDPKIWFTSIRSLAQVLSDENQALLKLIFENAPDSLKELSLLTGRNPGNLSRTLKTMSHYGFVELEKHAKGKEIRPVVKATDFSVFFGIFDRKVA